MELKLLKEAKEDFMANNNANIKQMKDATEVIDPVQAQVVKDDETAEKHFKDVMADRRKAAKEAGMGEMIKEEANMDTIKNESVEGNLWWATHKGEKQKNFNKRADLWDRVYNDLTYGGEQENGTYKPNAGFDNGSAREGSYVDADGMERSFVSSPNPQVFVDADGNIEVWGPNEESLDAAFDIANKYNCKISNIKHAPRFVKDASRQVGLVIYIPQDQVDDNPMHEDLDEAHSIKMGTHVKFTPHRAQWMASSDDEDELANIESFLDMYTNTEAVITGSDGLHEYDLRFIKDNFDISGIADTEFKIISSSHVVQVSFDMVVPDNYSDWQVEKSLVDSMASLGYEVLGVSFEGDDNNFGYNIEESCKKSINEDLSEDDWSNFNSEFYDALCDVIFKYNDKGLSENDIKIAIDWFDTHFFDSDDNITESFEDGKEFRLDSSAHRILDAVFEYLRNLKGDDEFINFAHDVLGMRDDELEYYCDIDLNENLNTNQLTESINSSNSKNVHMKLNRNR